jgi:hypothetical protein
MKIFIVATLTLVLTGCWKPEPTFTMLVMGDSIMQQQVGILTGQILMRDNAPIVINNAVGGITTDGPYWSGRINAARAMAPDLSIIFVSLGTNDGSLYSDDEAALYAEFPAAVDAIMVAATGVEVYWQLPNAQSSMNHREAVRTILFEAAAAHDNLYLIEPEVGTGWFIADDIHLSGKGVSGLVNVSLGIMAYEI